MKKVLVSGGSGFLGQHCLPLLLERGYEVHATSRRSAVSVVPGLFWHPVDLVQERQGADLIARIRPTHWLHLAWVTKHGEYWTTSENLNWVRASLEMTEAFAQHGGRRVVYAGTCAEYDWSTGVCSETVTPLTPTSLYGQCKHRLRLLTEANNAQSGIASAWGRLFFLYGPKENPQRLIPSVIRALIRGEPAQCTHGRQVRDFLFIADAADAMVTLLEQNLNGAINIASGVSLTLRDVVYKIADILARRDLICMDSVPTRADDPPQIVANVSRLRQELSWVPRWGLAEGLEQTIRWWQAHDAEKTGTTA